MIFYIKSNQEADTNLKDIAFNNYIHAVLNPLLHEDQINGLTSNFDDKKIEQKILNAQNPILDTLTYNIIHSVVRQVLKNKEMIEEQNYSEFATLTFQSVVMVIVISLTFRIIPKELKPAVKYLLLLFGLLNKYQGGIGFFREVVRFFGLMIILIIYSYCVRNENLRAVVLGIAAVLWEFLLISWF